MTALTIQNLKCFKQNFHLKKLCSQPVLRSEDKKVVKGEGK